MAEVIGLTTRLEAINVILDVIGAAPISALPSGTGRGDVLAAERALNESSREVQGEGWWFNQECDFSLAVSGGEIALPSNTLRFDLTDQNPAVEVVQRGLRLYNQTDQTFTFTEAVKGDLTVQLAWDETPEPFRRYAMIKAARRTNARRIGDTTTHQFTAIDEAEARMGLRAEDMRNRDASARNSPEIYEATNRWRR